MLSRSELPAAAEIVKGGSLVETIHSLINGSLSGALLPAMALDAYVSAPETLRRRAIQLGSLAPMVFGSHPEWLQTTDRSDFTAYFTVYSEEARDRGLPLIRALPIQFPKDPEAAKVSDEFMLGDEVLVAPIYGEQNSRNVYLPMGIWTRLSDNQVFSGKRTVTAEAGPDATPTFSRNGAILPLGSNPTTLHYFPKLGGEFFFFESDLGEYSQVHAGPAGEFFRFEIESKKDREYEWVAHHLERPRKVAEGAAEYRNAGDRERLLPGTWFYDTGEKNLHVRVKARAGGDEIVNVSF